MKLISLNIWCGKFFKPLIAFIKLQSEDTDIFCFQEMIDTKSDVKQYQGIRANLLSEIKHVLPDFKVFYFPTLSGYDDDAEPVDFDLTYGQAIFVKSSIKVISQENFIISKDENFHTLKKDFSNLPTPLQYMSFILGDKEISVSNFHGIPFPGNKLDTDKRLTEVKRTKEIIFSKGESQILVGDFNLLPETQSIKIFEEDMRNLIKEFNIQITRSTLSPFYGRPDFQKFADYAFVSNDIKVENFKVLI